MASIAELLMQEVFARLTGSPALLENGNVRRSHRTTVTRALAPAVHLIDGADEPKDANSDCRTERTKDFTVRVHGRDDEGVKALDSIVVEINSRLDGNTDAYPHGAVLKQRGIVPDEEIADADALRVDMGFTFEYQTAGWPLETAA